MTRRKRMLQQLDEEIRDHIDQETQDNIDRGMSQVQARFAARRRFGNVTRVREQVYEVWASLWFEQLIQDLRYGTRAMLRSPGLTVAAVLAIALGIGVNTGIFSVLNGLALRLLPVPHARELLSVNQILHFNGRGNRYVHNNYGYVSWSEYRDYRDHNQVFSGLAAYEPFLEATRAGSSAHQLLGTATSCNYFEVLEEQPTQGRGFVAADCASNGANAVVVVSNSVWRTQFGADPALIGKVVVLNRTPYTVIGIASPGFTGTEPVPSAFWVPVTMDEAMEPGEHRLANNNMSWLAMVGRARPDRTMAEIQADLDVIAQRGNQSYPGRTIALSVHPARFFSSPEEREFLLPISSVVFAAFALVLLIACANVSNLLLARASVRQQEIALRLSLGASRWRLIRQLLTESLLLSITGGSLGSLIAFLSFAPLTRFVTKHLPSDLPPITINVAPDLRVLLFSLALTLCAGIAFGVAPALQSTQPDLTSSMTGGSAAVGSGVWRGRFLLKSLVGAQVAVCMVLLLAAGLLLRGLYYAQTVDPGFEIQGVATTLLDLNKQGYNRPHATRFMQQFIERLRAMPGVLEVAQAECAPLSHDFSLDHFTLPGRSDQIPIEYNHITPNYFALTAIAIVRGRSFTPLDTREATSVIVSESTARRLWPGRDPLGQTLRESSGHLRTVVGVVRDAQVSHLGESNSNYLYYPFGTDEDVRNYVLVRYASGYSEVANEIRAAARATDANVSMDVTRLEDYLDVWRAPSRIVAGLSGALGALALLLCSIGVYGMVSYTVNRSVREIGIRLALGASKAAILRQQLRQAIWPILIGSAVGVILSALVSNVLSSMMFGVSPHDLFAFVGVPCFLLAIAALSTVIPARRALAVDPAAALRSE